MAARREPEFTATINAALSGNTQLVKTDAGTLVLGGTNSYAGGTLVSGGTVQIAADADLGGCGGRGDAGRRHAGDQRHH